MLIKVKICGYFLKKPMVECSASILNALFLFQITITNIYIHREVGVNGNEEIL